MLLIDTQRLIIELMNQELKKTNRLATRGYYKEIEEAKANFIEHTKTLGNNKNDKY
jgi:hypothetical protein